MKQYIKTDGNGTKYYKEEIQCPRCGGYGIYYMGVCNGELVPAHPDEGVCYRCGGSGKVIETIKEYTPEYLAKLDAKRIREQQKFEAERARIEAENAKREAEEQAKREAKEKAEAERKARSQYIGNVGDKIDMVVTFNFKGHYSVPSFRGYGETEMRVYNFTDENGNILVWKTTGVLWIETYDEFGHRNCINPEYGDKIRIKGTIKEHSEYKDEKQTVLNRVKLIEIIK